MNTEPHKGILYNRSFTWYLQRSSQMLNVAHRFSGGQLQQGVQSETRLQVKDGIVQNMNCMKEFKN